MAGSNISPTTNAASQRHCMIAHAADVLKIMIPRNCVSGSGDIAYTPLREFIKLVDLNRYFACPKGAVTVDFLRLALHVAKIPTLEVSGDEWVIATRSDTIKSFHTAPMPRIDEIFIHG